MKNKVSIYDIAKFLNVSPATVSYAINDVDKVSPKTRQRVLNACKKLNFVPNSTARSLSTGRTHLIGLYLPLDDPSLALSQNPFYVEFLAGIESGISQCDYDVVLGSQKVSNSFSSWAKSRNLDAAIMLGRYPNEKIEDIDSLKIPIILIDIYDSNLTSAFSIRTNDRLGTYKATKYLIENGHKKIGFVGYKFISQLDTERYQGYLDALKEANLEINEKYTYDALATIEDGYNVADKIYEDKLVTAVVCTADIIALGIIKKFTNLGLKIPQDLSIVGFDDIRDAKYSTPGLTTIKQDVFNKGFAAISTLIDEINGKNEGKKSLVTEPILIERNSVKKM